MHDSNTFKLFREAKDKLEKGEFKSNPTIGRPTYFTLGSLQTNSQENMFKMFKLFVSTIISGFETQIYYMIKNYRSLSYSGVMNTIIASCSRL